MTTSMSVSGAVEDSHRFTLPGPKKSTSWASGGVVYETEVPGFGDLVQLPLCDGAGPENDACPLPPGRVAVSARLGWKYSVTGFISCDQLWYVLTQAGEGALVTPPLTSCRIVTWGVCGQPSCPPAT